MARGMGLKLGRAFGLLLLVILLAACARAPATLLSSRQEEAAESVAVYSTALPGRPAPARELAYPGPRGGVGGAGARPSTRQGILDARQVIRTADLAIVVDDTQAAMSQLQSLANAFGGYIASANLWQVKDDLLEGSVTLRVDARNFDEALDRIKQIALEVQRENIGSQDVTQEYTDLKSRLRNLEATEQELLELLSEVRKRTRSADEVLQVYRYLTEIRDQIEQIKGRMQYLDHQVSLATINVELIPKEEKPIVQPGWQPGQTLRDALSALASAGQWLISALIWLVVFVLPVGLILAIPLGLVVAGFRRWRSQPAREST